MTGQDAADMLRDLTEAVATVAGRLLGLPPEEVKDMGLMEKKANEKFQADKARADKIAKAIAAEKKQDAKDRKGK